MMITKGMVTINALEIPTSSQQSWWVFSQNIPHPVGERLAMTEQVSLPGAGIHLPLLGFTFIDNDYIQLFNI